MLSDCHVVGFWLVLQDFRRNHTSAQNREPFYPHLRPSIHRSSKWISTTGFWIVVFVGDVPEAGDAVFFCNQRRAISHRSGRRQLREFSRSR